MNTTNPNTPRRFDRPELRDVVVLGNGIRFNAPPAPKPAPAVKPYPSLSDDGQPWFGNSSVSGINSSANLPWVRVIALLAVLAIVVALVLG